MAEHTERDRARQRLIEAKKRFEKLGTLPPASTRLYRPSLTPTPEAPPISRPTHPYPYQPFEYQPPGSEPYVPRPMLPVAPKATPTPEALPIKGPVLKKRELISPPEATLQEIEARFSQQPPISPPPEDDARGFRWATPSEAFVEPAKAAYSFLKPVIDPPIKKLFDVIEIPQRITGGDPAKEQFLLNWRALLRAGQTGDASQARLGQISGPGLRKELLLRLLSPLEGRPLWLDPGEVPRREFELQTGQALPEDRRAAQKALEERFHTRNPFAQIAAGVATDPLTPLGLAAPLLAPKAGVLAATAAKAAGAGARGQTMARLAVETALFPEKVPLKTVGGVLRRGVGVTVGDIRGPGGIFPKAAPVTEKFLRSSSVALSDDTYLWTNSEGAVQLVQRTDQGYRVLQSTAPPPAPASLAAKDKGFEIMEMAEAQQRIRAGATPSRAPGTPQGDDMRAPPPSSPHVALEDDLNLPTWEKPKTGISRKWEGARALEGLAMEDWLLRGQEQLNSLRLTSSEGSMRPLFEALHGEANPARLSGELRAVYDDIRKLVAQEEADMMAFLSQADAARAKLLVFDAENFAGKLMAHPDYFPRGWKDPGTPTTLHGRLLRRPPFSKPRVGATFTQLLQAGYTPRSWNPYVMMAERRIAGIEYRESVVLIDRLQKLGLALQNEAPKGWVVPKVGPVFEGRPFPQPGVEGGIGYTPPIFVPRDVANFLEGAFGIPSKPGLDAVLKFSTVLKRLKLVGSVFQHIDFAVRSLGPAFSLTGIRNGAPLRYPSLVARLIRAQFSPKARAGIRRQLLSDAPISKGFPLSNKMLIEEGWGIQGDISLIRREVTSSLRETLPTQGLPAQIVERVNSILRWFETGLFDGVYREAQRDALEKFIVPSIRRAHPDWAPRQVAADAATQVNIMFSTLGRWQTVLKDPVFRDFVHILAFSSNESEGLIRQFIGAIVGPNKRLWQEYYLGVFVGLAVIGNLINISATGKPMPASSYSPVRFNDPYAPFFGFGYNTHFLSPQIPLLKGRGGHPVYLDLVGQMDTVLRWITDPRQAVAARVNVFPRAIINQLKGETFFGQKLRPWYKHITQGAMDIAAPISATQLLGAAREQFPGLSGILPESEARLGVLAQGAQAFGINIRSMSTMQLLESYTKDNFAVPYDELEPYERIDLGNLPGIKEELALRGATATATEAPNALYYARLDQIEAERLAALTDLPLLWKNERITKREFGQKFYDAESRAAISREATRAAFGKMFEEKPLSEEQDKNKRALMEYFLALDKAETEGGIFLPAAFRKALDIFMADWDAAQKEYVLRNIKTRPIPRATPGGDLWVALEKSGNKDALNKYKQSEAARERHRKTRRKQ